MRLSLLFALLAISWSLGAQERHSDPDGCFSCHGLPGLEFIDEDGVRRTASILRKDYYSSLHGSVPCRDCHRQIQDYPHDPKNGFVDCAQSCHIEEPSQGKAFSHRDVVDEFERSAHGKGQHAGWTKDLHGGNRLEEVEEQQNPSCRRCHFNEPYIKPDRLPIFFEAFDHVDMQCGNCHQGEVWRDQYAGHILRRLVGKHYSKNEENQMCINCHGDLEAMSRVEIENPEKSEAEQGVPQLEPAGPRFVLAAESYAKFLHGRLLKVGDENGASCLDCHAPVGSGARHDIMRAYETESATHEDELPVTCGQSGCHLDYAHDPRNAGFLYTDMHDVAWVDASKLLAISLSPAAANQESIWFTVLMIVGPIAALFLLGQIGWWWWERLETSEPLLGADRFRRVMLGMNLPEKRWPWQKPASEVTSLQSKPDELNDSLIILYASQTGNAEELAERQFNLAESWQLPVRLVNMAEFAPRELVGLRYLFLLVSTQGEGEPPLTAQTLHHYLKELAAREHATPLLGHLHYAVFSLGDSSYRYFCQCGKDFDAYLHKLGATPALPRVDGDVDFEEAATEWMAQVITVYRQLSGHEGVEPPPEVKPASTGYGRQRPYLARILSNTNLNTSQFIQGNPPC